MWFWKIDRPARSGYIFVGLYLIAHALLFVGLTALGLAAISGALGVPLAISQVTFNPYYFTAVMFGLALAFGIAAAVPLKPWAWQYTASVLALSLGLILTLPLAIFALGIWLRDEIKRPFGILIQGPDVALPPEDRRLHHGDPAPGMVPEQDAQILDS
ncbi:hypothetical protein DL240_03740 [Lujinxingia litoralis]|uniref:Uncharacterized protein n=1 Tax=Lujinxingia litoralis TaxID=2211119 RepID=A0A328CEH9_9DELT|nr:hypothetical protein [Lujinxingia litoralis]RAL25333.1 hypothetical protein DL240_03740 [Lujinxingia litoralis]